MWRFWSRELRGCYLKRSGFKSTKNIYIRFYLIVTSGKVMANHREYFYRDNYIFRYMIEIDVKSYRFHITVDICRKCFQFSDKRRPIWKTKLIIEENKGKVVLLYLMYNKFSFNVFITFLFSVCRSVHVIFYFSQKHAAT